jgi:hypothetical protein
MSTVTTLTTKKERLYLPLGTGEVVKYGVGPEAALLDAAARAGLPVPASIILVDEAWTRALGNGLVRQTDAGMVIAPDPTRLIVGLRLPNFEWEFTGPFAVKAAFSSVEGQSRATEAPAAVRLGVDARDTGVLAEALCAVWGAAPGEPGQYRRDVLIMRMVDAQFAGVAITERAYEDDIARTGEDGEGIMLPKLRGGEQTTSASDAPAWHGRLQRLLRDVRRVFNRRRLPHDWEIEWADDGKTCWLVALRPVAHPPQRDEAFVLLDADGFAGGRVGPFLTSLLVSCAPGVEAFFRGLDRGPISPRPFIAEVDARPGANLSLMMDSLRRLGLPSRIAPEAFGVRAPVDYPARPRRMLRRPLASIRFWLMTRRAARRADQLIQEMNRRAEQSPETLHGVIEALRWLHMTHLAGALALAAAGASRDPLAQAAQAASRRLHEALLAVTGRMTDAGQLPDQHAIWMLRVEEVERLEAGWAPGADFWTARRAEIGVARTPDSGSRIIYAPAAPATGQSPPESGDQ